MNRGPQVGPQYPRPAGQTILATALPSGAQLSPNPQGQLVDSSGNVVVDVNGTPLTSLPQVIAAQQGASAALAPIAPPPAITPIITQTPNALAAPAPKWQSQLVRFLWIAAAAAAVYGAAYFGAKAAIRRARIARHNDRRSRRSKRSSRRAAAAE